MPRLGNLLGNDVRHAWASLPYFAWASLPYFALPSAGVRLLVGEAVTIYGDSLINVPIVNSLSVTYTCNIGTQTGNNFTVNPVIGDIGSHSLVIVFKNAGLTFLTKTVNLVVEAKLTLGATKVLLIGDSVVSNGITEIAAAASAAAGVVLTFLGSKGTTVKHEGISGYSWHSFNISTSPFFKSGVLNVAAYFTDNSIATPDIVHFRLGVNEMYQNCANDLTAPELAAIVTDINALLTAFLAFNADLQIIIGLPTICENTGAGWNANYDESVYLQDKYIELIHKFSEALITNYDNAAFNARVSISNEVIFLDRNDGYPKTGGVHNNGVHPDASGNAQLGQGHALSINRFVKPVAPSAFAAVWTNDYAALSWIDNTGGAAVYEVWESRNGAAYTLVTTTAAGATTYNNYTWQNESMAFKVRAKVGGIYSNYSSIVSLTTPLVFKTDQSVLTPVVFTYLYVQAGKTVNVNWGDGTNNNYSGANDAVTHNYSATANPYYVKITGDVNFITQLTLQNQVKLYGDLTKWKLPNIIGTLYLQASNFTGDWTNWVIPDTLQYHKSATGMTCNITGKSMGANRKELRLYGTGISGDITGLGFVAGQIYFYVMDCTNLVGDLSGWVVPSTLTYCYIVNNRFTKFPLAGNFTNLAGSTAFRADSNRLSSADVDAFLVALNNAFATYPPTRNATYNLGGSGMGAATSTGLAARTAILAKFTAAGFTATITVN